MLQMCSCCMVHRKYALLWICLITLLRTDSILCTWNLDEQTMGSKHLKARLQLLHLMHWFKSIMSTSQVIGCACQERLQMHYILPLAGTQAPTASTLAGEAVLETQTHIAADQNPPRSTSAVFHLILPPSLISSFNSRVKYTNTSFVVGIELKISSISYLSPQAG